MYALDKLTNLLPVGWRPYAKAVYPAIGTAVAVAIQWIATGEFDRAEFVTAVTGIPAALLTFAVPNHHSASTTRDVDAAPVSPRA